MTFQPLYTTIPHSQLKDRLKKLIHQSSVKQNGNAKQKYLISVKKMSYVVREHTACSNKYIKGNILKMPDFLIDSIFVEFGGQVFQQTVGIPKGTNCEPLLADLFYSYEAELTKRN